MVSVREETEVNGNTYKIQVREHSDYRKVAITPKEYGWAIVIDRKYKDHDRSLLDKILGRNKPEPYPDRTKHVADALNKAISKYENKLERHEEMREEMQCAIDAAEVWEDE